MTRSEWLIAAAILFAGFILVPVMALELAGVDVVTPMLLLTPTAIGVWVYRARKRRRTA